MTMTGLLSLVFTFVSSLPPNLASAFIEEKLKKAKLRKINSDLRKYLLQRTSEYDFERLDDYLTSNGYSTQYEDDVLPNDILDAAVSDFFAKNPDVFYNKVSLTPILKSAIQYAHSELYKTLGSEHRLLYKQSVSNQNELLHEFDDVKKLISTLQESQKNISHAMVSKLYGTAISSIKSGYISIANDLLRLLPEFNLPSECMPLYLALKIQVDYFLTARISEDNLKRYVNTSTDESTLIDTITFLFQTNNYQMLKILVPSVRNQNILNLIDIANSDNQPEEIRDRLTENLVVRPCYLEFEATFWYIANYQKNTMRFSAAESHFLEISTKFPNIWADLYACQSRIQNVILQHVLIVQLNKEVQDALEKEMRKYLHFLFVFSGCEKSFETTYWEIFLLAASSFEREHFLSLMKECPANIKESNAFVAANYDNMLDNSVVFDISSFLDFCDAIKDSRLLLHYLAIQYDSKNYDKIIEALKGREFFLRTNITILDIYIQSVIEQGRVEEALETLYSLKEHYKQAFDYLILEANVLAIKNDMKAEYVLNKAYEFALNPGCEQMSISGISKLTSLLCEHDRFEDAISLLDIYSKQSAPLLFEKLRLLMKKDIVEEDCSMLVEQLISDGFFHPLVYQYRGMIKEKKLEGSGLPDFEKAFSIKPSIQTAYSILAARIVVSKCINDLVLDYACKAESPILTCLAAQVFQKLHSPDLESFYLLKALLETNETYDNRIYGYYFMNSVQHEQKEQTKPIKVQENIVVTLESLYEGLQISICFHGESMLIPAKGSKFANCHHVSCSDYEYLKMKYKKIDDIVSWRGDKYKIIGIEDRTTFFSKHCINNLIINNDVLTLESRSSKELLAKVNALEIARNQDIEQTIKDSLESQFGLPLHTIGMRFGRTDFDVVRHLLFSDKPFMSGINDLICTPPFVLTLSSIYVLGFLGISSIPSTYKDTFLVSHFTYKKLEEECEEVCKSADFTAGLIWSDAETGHFLHYTDEIRASVHSQAADMRSLIDSCTILEELNPELYVPDISPINQNIGRNNYEALSLAKDKGLSMICDDLCIRRIANGFGVNSANAIDVIVLLGLGYSKVIEIASTLLRIQYQFPITLTLLNYLSSQFDLLKETGESTDEISRQVKMLFEIATDNQIFWMNFLNQIWMFARQDILRNLEFSSLVFRFALVVSAKVDHLNQSTVLADNPIKET